MRLLKNVVTFVYTILCITTLRLLDDIATATENPNIKSVTSISEIEPTNTYQ